MPYTRPGESVTRRPARSSSRGYYRARQTVVATSAEATNEGLQGRPAVHDSSCEALGAEATGRTYVQSHSAGQFRRLTVAFSGRAAASVQRPAAAHAPRP